MDTLNWMRLDNGWHVSVGGRYHAVRIETGPKGETKTMWRLTTGKRTNPNALAVVDTLKQAKAKAEEHAESLRTVPLGGWKKEKPVAKPCPSCGAPLELVKASEGGRVEEQFFPSYPLRDAELPRRSRPASFWACPGCEHCEEASASELS